MPTISEVSSSMVPPAENSPESSLQVSSTTSPEVGTAPTQSRALSVRKPNVKHSSRSSSSSSRASLPPTGLSRIASGGSLSHRGQGSIPSQHMHFTRTEGNMEVDVDVYQDQRSLHHEQHFYDQRNQQQFNLVQVGLDPEAASARENQIRVEALNAVAQMHQQSHEAQRAAESSVSNAELRVAQVQSEASVALSQLHAQHQEEVNRLQTIANQANMDLTVQLRNATEENRMLNDQLNLQQEELKQQKGRFDELQATMLSLQHELTVVRHQQSATPSSPQNGTDLGELLSCMDALRAEVRQMKEDNLRRSQDASPSALPTTFNIHTPPDVRSMPNPSTWAPNVQQAVSPIVSPTRSACAGYPPAFNPVANPINPNLTSKSPIFHQAAPPQPPSPGSSTSSSSSDGKKSKGPGAPWESPVSTNRSSGGPPYGFPQRDPGGGGSPGGGDGDPGFNAGYGQMRGTRSVAAGSGLLVDEGQIYKAKDLQSITVPALPTDAAQFRGWRNSFLTKASSIDRTGQNRIMTWLLESFSADVTVEYLQQTSLEMPRLDAYLASQLMEPKHLRGELGLQFQAYTEREQLRGRAPLGRVLLNMVARRFFLDLSRGANLTQQSLLELDISAYTYEGLRTFVDRVEYVLNSIPPELQPSELTRYTWLYSRLKKVRLMQRHIDRIKDSRHNSHVRCWDWLFGKLKTTLIEMKEDQNEESIRAALQAQAKAKSKTKGNVAQTGEGDDAAATAVAAKAKPKAKAKAKTNATPNPKGDSKGKQLGPGAAANPASKGGGAKGDAKAKAKPKPSDTPSAHCIFWPKGTCNRGDTCPFVHDPKFAPKQSAAAAKAAPGPKGGAQGGSSSSTSAAKATVAAVVASSLPKASASEVRPDAQWATSTNQSWFYRTANAFVRPFVSFFKCVTTLLCLTDPMQHIPPIASLAIAPPGASQGMPAASLAFAPPGASQGMPLASLAFAPPGASQGMPAVLAHQHAMIAQYETEGSYEISWIADSGAGRDLASMKAFQEQGIPKQCLDNSLQTIQHVRFETGNGCVKSDTAVVANGSKFGEASFHVMQSCPLVRSLGQIVESGKPFIWLPGQLPFFGVDENAVQLAADSERIHVADKVDDHVPIFSENMQLEKPCSFGLPAAAPETAAVPEPVGPEVPPADVAGGDADSEDADQEPRDKYTRLLQEAASIEHKRLHLPKNPTCEICQRSRMYRKRTSSKRYDPLESRGDLPVVTSFGERLACDFIIVSKSRTEGRDNVVLVIRDEFSGFIRACPCGSKSSEIVNKHLLAFLGPSYHEKPSIMVKSDQAKEFLASCNQLGFQHEPTLEHRFPHNAVLEREIRTVEEITRALHLQSGFHMYQDLWPLSVSHAALMVSCFHNKPDAEESRYKLACGHDWKTRDLLLGQLVYVRDLGQQKFGANAKPAIFAGYRMDTGPKFRDVFLVLDYQSLKNKTPGYHVAGSVPTEEIYCPEGPPVLPLAAAAQNALAEFGSVNLDNIPHLEVPFSSLEPTAPPRERNEYITLERLIKYGATPGCHACSKAAGTHSAACKARFNGLIRADRIAIGSKTLKSSSVPLTPALDEVVEPEPLEESTPPDEAEKAEDPASLPFSAGIDPAHPEFGAVGKINQKVDAEFVESNALRRRARRVSDLKGVGLLYEYACSDTSIIGQIAEQIGVKCVRLSRSIIDLEKAANVQQACGQLDEVPGADVWVSLTCTYFSPLQHLNVAVHGEEFAKKLYKAQKKSIKMLQLAFP